jgi:hypothetical protein
MELGYKSDQRELGMGIFLVNELIKNNVVDQCGLCKKWKLCKKLKKKNYESVKMMCVAEIQVKCRILK